MTRNLLRILFVFLSAILCATAGVSTVAKDWEKPAVRAAVKGSVDFAQVGFPGVVNKGFMHLNAKYPDKGTFAYHDFAGPWAGSYGMGKIIAMHFDLYDGPIEEVIQESPMVYLLCKFDEGEDVFDATDYPGFPEFPTIGSLEGWYKVYVAVDGGPGHKDDWLLGPAPMFPPIYENDEAIDLFYDFIENGMLWFKGEADTGNIRILFEK